MIHPAIHEIVTNVAEAAAGSERLQRFVGILYAFRTVTAASVTPFFNTTCNTAFDRSPRSMMIPSLPAPSSPRKGEDGVRTRAAAINVCFESMDLGDASLPFRQPRFVVRADPLHDLRYSRSDLRRPHCSSALEERPCEMFAGCHEYIYVGSGLGLQRDDTITCGAACRLKKKRQDAKNSAH